MQSQLLLILGCFCFILVATATHQAGLRAELEASKVCFTRFNNPLWNTVMCALPEAVRSDADKIAKVFSIFHAALRVRLPPCRAVERALLTAGVSSHELPPCYNRALVTLDGLDSLESCLRMAHRLAIASIPKTQSEEAAAAANMRSASTSDAGLAYSGTYADAYTQRVVDDVLREQTVATASDKTPS